MPPASAALAERLTCENLALADSVARRFFSAGRRDDDLIQVARIGLWKAACRYDPSRGGFAAFAVPTIAGELKRHLRDHGWFVRPPRALQELRAQVAEASARLGQSGGHSPSIAELAVDVGCSAELVREAIDVQQHLRPASLDAPAGAETPATLADVLADGGAAMERAELNLVLWAALRALTPRERLIVHARFFEDRTQQDIATELGVTQMQVSRILTKCLGMLRTRIVHGAPVRRSAS